MEKPPPPLLLTLPGKAGFNPVLPLSRLTPNNKATDTSTINLRLHDASWMGESLVSAPRRHSQDVYNPLQYLHPCLDPCFSLLHCGAMKIKSILNQVKTPETCVSVHRKTDLKYSIIIPLLNIKATNCSCSSVLFVFHFLFVQITIVRIIYMFLCSFAAISTCSLVSHHCRVYWTCNTYNIDTRKTSILKMKSKTKSLILSVCAWKLWSFTDNCNTSPHTSHSTTHLSLIHNHLLAHQTRSTEIKWKICCKTEYSWIKTTQLNSVFTVICDKFVCWLLA